MEGQRMSAEEKSMILEQIAKMAEADKAFVTGWAAGRLSMVKPKEEKPEEEKEKIFLTISMDLSSR